MRPQAEDDLVSEESVQQELLPLISNGLQISQDQRNETIPPLTPLLSLAPQVRQYMTRTMLRLQQDPHSSELCVVCMDNPITSGFLHGET